MYDHGQKQNSPGKVSGKTGSATESERRIADRHIFTASAEVVDLSSGARFSTRTTDLGPGGCFVDTMVPFPVGASVHVYVHKGETRFETDGVVVYSQLGLGMGIAFDVMELTQREALEAWLAALTSGRQPAPNRREQSEAHAPAPVAIPPVRNSSAALVRLVKLMIGKGILTEGEGTSILHEPLL
jgi:hypothetical protein